jgi:hypothetical protein
MGNMPFSSMIKLLMNCIKAWTLLLKKANGNRVSSRNLDRVLKKAQLENKEKIMGTAYFGEQLKREYRGY